jgi:Phosphotransferase enzyme family
VLYNPSLNLCSPGNLFTHTSPNKIHTIVIENSVPIRQIVLEGWRLLSTFVPPDILDLLLHLADNPLPLTNALSGYPQTLVHGDWRPANIGIEREGKQRLVLLDWSRPTQTVPAADLAYYLVTSWSVLPVSKEACIDLYRQFLTLRLGNRLDESWWQPQLELSLLSAFLMIGCFNAWSAAQTDEQEYLDRARANFTWWSEQVRAGARWLKR